MSRDSQLGCCLVSLAVVVLALMCVLGGGPGVGGGGVTRRARGGQLAYYCFHGPPQVLLEACAECHVGHTGEDCHQCEPGYFQPFEGASNKDGSGCFPCGECPARSLSCACNRSRG